MISKIENKTLYKDGVLLSLLRPISLNKGFNDDWGIFNQQGKAIILAERIVKLSFSNKNNLLRNADKEINTSNDLKLSFDLGIIKRFKEKKLRDYFIKYIQMMIKNKQMIHIVSHEAVYLNYLIVDYFDNYIYSLCFEDMINISIKKI